MPKKQLMDQPNDNRIPIILILVLFTIILIRSAWICDDAFILFRTADNFIHGYGLRWNIAERVQTFTCPLWLFIISIFSFVTREFFYTTLALTIVISLMSACLIGKKLFSTPLAAIGVLAALLSSQAFMDFSTAGLGNPLIHLLIVLFFLFYKKENFSPRDVLWIGLIVCASLLSRLDTLLIYLPALIYIIVRYPKRTYLKQLLLGFSPLILWELFSLFYYGFPFPNTAYAKLPQGIAISEFIHQGILYTFYSIDFDPVTILMIVSGIIISCLKKNKYTLLALGVILYWIYILRIGGDFMGGRFFAAPFLVSAILVGYGFPWEKPLYGSLAIAAIVLIGVLPKYSSWKSVRSYENEIGSEQKLVNGIANERKFYFDQCGLMFKERNNPLHKMLWAYWGWRLHQDHTKVKIYGAIGMRCFYAGPGTFIIDYCALSDPLLARLPMKYDPLWRPGHYVRAIPPGYYETQLSDTNQIRDEQLKEYYDKITLITRGPLWSMARFAAIWKMNWGSYDHLISTYQYRFGQFPHIPAQQLSTPFRDNTPSDTKGVISIPKNNPGLMVLYPQAQYAHSIEISADDNNCYFLTFINKDKIIATIQLPIKLVSNNGALSVRTLDIPPSAAKNGFDRILIHRFDGDDIACIGHIRLLP